MFPRRSRPHTIAIKLWPFIRLQICIIYDVQSGSGSSLQACYYTLLGSESGPLCAPPDNTVYTERTDGILLHNAVHWVGTSVTHTQVLETSTAKKTQSPLLQDGGVHSETVWMYFCASLYPNFNVIFHYYHNISVTSPFFPFTALLRGAAGAFIISICRLIFMHTSAQSQLCFDWLSPVKMPKHILIWRLASRGAVLRFPHIVVIYTS